MKGVCQVRLIKKKKKKKIRYPINEETHDFNCDGSLQQCEIFKKSTEDRAERVRFKTMAANAIQQRIQKGSGH